MMEFLSIADVFEVLTVSTFFGFGFSLVFSLFPVVAGFCKKIALGL